MNGELSSGRKAKACGTATASRCCIGEKQDLSIMQQRAEAFSAFIEEVFLVQKITTKTIVYTGVFTALTVLLSYIFSIRTTFVHITFGFLPVALFGAMFGPWKAGIVAALADIIGTAALGTSIFFPGFTLSSFLTGWIYGYFFYQREISWKTAWLPFLLVTVLIHLGLNTLWLMLFYQKAAGAIFISRLFKNLLCYPLEISLFLMVYRSLAILIPHRNK